MQKGIPSDVVACNVRRDTAAAPVGSGDTAHVLPRAGVDKRHGLAKLGQRRLHCACEHDTIVMHAERSSLSYVRGPTQLTSRTAV